MTLYLYKLGTATPILTMKNVVSYTAEQVLTENGCMYGPFAEDCELSSTPDCSEMLRKAWREANPNMESRTAALESAVLALMMGGMA